MTDEPLGHDHPAGQSWWASRQTRAFAATVLAPLGDDESDAAARVALDAVVGHGSVRADRLTVYPPRVRVEKPPRRDEAPSRQVWVRVRDADRQVVHEITVVDGVVVGHEVDEHGSPPFTDDERAAARRLLEGDSRFSGLLADTGVELEWFSPGHGPERLLGARFVRLDGTRVVDDLDTAVVDLDRTAIVEGGDLDG
jgi:hypothetical protein